MTAILDSAPSLLAFGMPYGMEWVIILAIGLLLFGRRLPEVGRSLGHGIVEFKKGLKGVTDEVERAGDPERKSPQQIADKAGHDAAVPHTPAPDRVENERADRVD